MAIAGVAQQRQRQVASTPLKQKKASTSNSTTTTNMWETMLRDAMRRSRLPDGTLVFVGTQGCGKSSLLDTFLEGSSISTSLANPSGGAAAAAAAATAPQAASDSGPESGAGGGKGGATGPGGASGSGTAAGDGQQQQAATALGFHPVLAYSYLDATDPGEQGPERDDSPPRISVWCCSEIEFEGLLQTVLNSSSLGNTCVVVGVDLSRPWEVMEAVEKWTGVLEKHMMGLMKQLSLGAQDDLRTAVKHRLTGAQPGAGNSSGSSQQETEGFLEKNLGVPIVVVGCKADSLQSETFEQQQRLHFIQQSLRRFCLKYGAALIYTSAKDGVNCGLLHRYLLSCLYPDAFPCREEGQTTDAAFIPAGWDSKRLIDGLLSPDKTPWGPNASYEDVVVAPPGALRGSKGSLGSGAEGGVGEGSGAASGAKGLGGSGGLGADESVEKVESEEAWLSSLGKQVSGGTSRWPSAIAKAKEAAKSNKSARPNPANVPDPRSFFANLLASGSSTVSPPKAPSKKKP